MVPSLLPAFLGLAILIFLHRRAAHNKTIKLEQQLECSKALDETDRLAYDIFGMAKALELAYHFRRRSSLSYTNALFVRYGETYASNVLGRRTVFTCNQENITHLLSTAFADFDSSPMRKPLFEPITPHGIFTLDGADWKASRAQLRGRLADLRKAIDLDIVERHFQAFLTHVRPDGGRFDVQACTFGLSMDLQTCFSLGESVDALSFAQSKEKKDFCDDLRLVKQRIVDDGFRGPLRHLFPRGRFLRACERVREFVLAQATREVKARKDAGGKENLTNDISVSADQALSILLANDSMSTTLSGMFYCLSKDERVVRTLRDSIVGTVGLTPPTWGQLGSLHYVRWVVFEAMRLYPPVVLNARVANKHTTLPHGGHAKNSHILIQEGETVVFSTWARHRLGQDFGIAAKTFHPERWEHLSGDSMPGFIPFNKGPRICPGQHYAMIVLTYIVARVFQTFDTVVDYNTGDWKERIAMTFENENGVLIGLQ